MGAASALVSARAAAGAWAVDADVWRDSAQLDSMKAAMIGEKTEK
jgi:hypothetical protein